MARPSLHSGHGAPDTTSQLAMSPKPGSCPLLSWTLGQPLTLSTSRGSLTGDRAVHGQQVSVLTQRLRACTPGAASPDSGQRGCPDSGMGGCLGLPDTVSPGQAPPKNKHSQQAMVSPGQTEEPHGGKAGGVAFSGLGFKLYTLEAWVPLGTTGSPEQSHMWARSNKKQETPGGTPQGTTLHMHKPGLGPGYHRDPTALNNVPHSKVTWAARSKGCPRRSAGFPHPGHGSCCFQTRMHGSTQPAAQRAQEGPRLTGREDGRRWEGGRRKRGKRKEDGHAQTTAHSTDH